MRTIQRRSSPRPTSGSATLYAPGHRAAAGRADHPGAPARHGARCARTSSSWPTGMRDVPATLRAHVKVHKSPHIARMQVEHGAIGVGCATVWEAIVMARAGIDDVFVINEVVGAGEDPGRSPSSPARPT